MTNTRPITSVLRDRAGASRVTNIELFYDLVYVFAITQLSHSLLAHLGVEGAVQAAILLAMVWQVWVYTTWATNYVDPARTSMRALLLMLMFGSLVLAAQLPEAFGRRGWVVAGAYAVMQVGRAVYLVVALRGEQLQWVFRRIGVWSAAASAVVLAGAAVDGHARELLWVLGVAIEVAGAAVGFHVPGLGRSATTDWTISGAHFAERCQAFVLIALGESIVVIGARLGDISHPDAHELAVFVAAFLGSVGFWWVYFDRAAEDSAEAIAASADPGRLARSAFHWVHPLMIAGIVVAAASDERVLEDPAARGDHATAWLVLGGTALFLGGHALFKAILWHVVSWQRIVAVGVLLALALLAPHVTALTMGVCALAVIVVVALADRITAPPRAG